MRVVLEGVEEEARRSFDVEMDLGGKLVGEVKSAETCDCRYLAPPPLPPPPPAYPPLLELPPQVRLGFGREPQQPEDRVGNLLLAHQAKRGGRAERKKG
eukprot:484034-Hanusia_phi.AAC.1